MIILQSKVNIIDNTGGAQGRCIKILKPKGTKKASIGDVILISVISTAGLKEKLEQKSTNIKAKKGEIYKALIVRTKSIAGRKKKQDIRESWNDNAVVLIKDTETFQPIGTRFKGPISSSLLRHPNFVKVVSIANSLYP